MWFRGKCKRSNLCSSSVPLLSRRLIRAQLYLVVVWWKLMGWVMGSLPTARRRSARPLARRRTTYPIIYINKRSNLHFEVARNLNGNTTAAAEDAYFVVRVEHLEFSGTAYWEVKLRIVSES